MVDSLGDKQKELFKKVQEIFEETPVYLVGGAVRDILLGNEPKDYDFCTSLEPDFIEASIKSSGRRAYLTGKRFGTIGCKIDGQMIEVTTFRSESYEPNNRKPNVEFVTDITEDLSRRDFTINAMAIRLDNLKLIDPFNGQEDMKNKVLRCVGNPKIRFKEDPLRMLRAIRFATRFGLEIDKKTYEKIEHMAPSILDISKERWMMELDKILLEEEVRAGLLMLWHSKLFNYMIPELSLQFGYDQNSKYHPYTLDMHTSEVVNACPKDINLRWAALLHDIAKPFVRTDVIRPGGGCMPKTNYVNHEILGAEMVDRIATHLKWSNERREKVVALVRHHLEDTCPLRFYDNQGKGGKGNGTIQ